MAEVSEIANWYRDRAILITGATGFMGKVLIEKLLRSCPDIGRVYMLIRKKKTLAANDRIDKLLKCQIFDELLATRKNLKDKLFVVSGDVGEPGLGISDEYRKILQETVSVVFHAAATIRFNEGLRLAVTVNLEGTKALLQLCKGMPKLCAFVHVSTAFSNCTRSTIEERLYEPPIDPENIVRCIKCLDDDALKLLEPSLLSGHPNTYTYTKAITEHVVGEFGKDFPTVVVRPSIVTASLKEPFPGWIDSYAGPTGFIAIVWKGLRKSIVLQKQMIVDLIPVDMSINLFIAAAWHIGTSHSSQSDNRREAIVYNCVSRPFNPRSWGEFLTKMEFYCNKYGTQSNLLPPNIHFTKCGLKNWVINFLFQTLPAAVLDSVLWMSGGQPKYLFYGRQLNSMQNVLRYFLCHEWNFGTGNAERLKNHLSPVDRKIFDFDLSNICWDNYFDSFTLGIRRHIMRESDDTIVVASRKNARMLLLTKIGLIVILATFVTVALQYFNVYYLALFFGVLAWAWSL